MRLLVIHSELGVLRGGGENFSRQLFPAFAARGHHVTAAFAADLRGRYPLPLPPGIEPLPVCGWWSSAFGQAALSSLGRFAGVLPAGRRAIERVQESAAWRTFAWHKRRFQRRLEARCAGLWHEFDAVYVHGDVTLASHVAGRRPTVVRLPGPVAPECAPLLRAVHAVCSNGDALVRTRAFLGDGVLDLPLGLDTRRFSPGSSTVRSRLGWNDRHKVAGYAGRLTRLKGTDILAGAFRQLARDVPDARLLILGTGEEEKALRRVLASECAAGLVHIEPGIDHDELPAWYRAMDVMVMPSRYENHSNALVEAMACGVPFVASDTGGNSALLESGGGWPFEPGSVPSLAAALKAALEDRNSLRQRGEISTRTARRHGSWAVTAARLESIIETRMAGRFRCGERS